MFFTLEFKNIQEKKTITSQVLVNEHKVATKNIYVVTGNYINHFSTNIVLNSGVHKTCTKVCAPMGFNHMCNRTMFGAIAKHLSKVSPGLRAGSPSITKPVFEMPQVSVNNTSQRNFGLTAGHFKTPIPKQQPSTSDDNVHQVQSDVSGKHKVVVVSSCKDQHQCHKRLCDTTHENICPHKAGSEQLITELAGNLTHKIPKGKQGIKLDESDAAGQKKPQFLVTEITTVPVEFTNVKKNDSATEFIQRTNIPEIVSKNLPKNSTLNLKNTSQIDTPEDHEK